MVIYSTLINKAAAFKLYFLKYFYIFNLNSNRNKCFSVYNITF